MNKPTKQKVFLALWPNQTIRQQLDAVAAQIYEGGKPVPAKNLHLTLVFIGYVDSDTLQCVRDVAGEIKAEPFSLTIDKLGSFKSKVLWLGCQTVPDPLVKLQHSLTLELQKACGYLPEKRPYSPHITLQRKIQEPVSTELEFPIVWPINGFSLILSEPGNTSPKYSEIGRWDFE